MSDGVDVSVVIATRDRAAFLRQAVRSVLSQEGVRVQLVVVDDGSRDATPALLAALDDPRLTVLRNERGEGTSGARNRGLALARGTWTAFLDDDDLWAPERLRRHAENAGDAVLSWAGQLEVDPARNVVGVLPAPTAETVRRHLRSQSLIGGPSAVVARTDALRRVGGFTAGLRFANDWDLWLKLHALGRGVAVADLLVAYCLHETNMSRTDPAGFVADLERLEREHVLGPDAAARLLAWLEAEGRAAGDARMVRWARVQRARRTRRPLDVARAVWALRAGAGAAAGAPPARPRYVRPAWLTAYEPVA